MGKQEMRVALFTGASDCKSSRKRWGKKRKWKDKTSPKTVSKAETQADRQEDKQIERQTERSFFGLSILNA